MKNKETKALTKRQRKFVQKVIETGSWTRAAVEAGYANREYGSVLKRREVIREAVLAALEKAGVSSDLIAQKIREGLDATIPARVGKDGAVLSEERPDHIARNLYIDKVLRITGLFGANGGVGNGVQNLSIDESKSLTIMVTPEMLSALTDAGVFSENTLADCGNQKELSSENHEEAVTAFQHNQCNLTQEE